eukprot:509226-Amorphochlora_amoeboformis.AAC.1
MLQKASGGSPGDSKRRTGEREFSLVQRVAKLKVNNNSIETRRARAALLAAQMRAAMKNGVRTGKDE